LFRSRTDQTFDLSQLWPQRTAIGSVLCEWGADRANGNDTRGRERAMDGSPLQKEN
jgi:hypothetical protein